MRAKRQWIVCMTAIIALLCRSVLAAELGAGAGGAPFDDRAAASAESATLERDCPNYGIAYMLGVFDGRCDDVDEVSATCVCRTVCPLCAAGSPSAIKCAEALACGDLEYWRHANATARPPA
jgi:hypothetical protein